MELKDKFKPNEDCYEMLWHAFTLFGTETIDFHQLAGFVLILHSFLSSWLNRNE